MSQKVKTWEDVYKRQIFALQDSFGTACNVTGDGALAMMMEGIFNRNRQLDDRFGTGE